jgi:hypothetical protein
MPSDNRTRAIPRQEAFVGGFRLCAARASDDGVRPHPILEPVRGTALTIRRLPANDPSSPQGKTA